MRPLLFCVLSLPLLAHAAPEAAAPAQPEAAAPAAKLPLQPPLRHRLDKDTIRVAIAAAPADTERTRRRDGQILSATPYEGFARDFAGARLPDCLHADGLRNQPTFFLNGVLALPFIAVAKLRGVCR